MEFHPRELRIGNIVFVGQGSTAYNVATLDRATVGLTNERGSFDEYYYNSITPIPLTEEWLLKFGFQKQYDEYVWDYKGCRIEKIVWGDDEPDWKFRRILGNELPYWKHETPAINFVHQLQNYIFCLCGHELTIKELV